MPGLFAALGIGQEAAGRLHAEFSRAWGNCQVVIDERGCIGGHAHGSARSLFGCKEVHFAIDGDVSAYHAAGDVVDERMTSPSAWSPPPIFRGNVVRLDLASAELLAVVEWTGTFPLYYVRLNGGLAICSRQRPLAALSRASSDPLAVLQFVRSGYLLSDRSFFGEIHRLMPGQTLRFRLIPNDLSITESSRLWVDLDSRTPANPEVFAEDSWGQLTLATRSGLAEASTHAIMMSGGWDSRTLLASATRVSGRTTLMAYCHGDVRSRELSIARRVARGAQVPYHDEPIDGRIFDPTLLTTGFEREETVVFPHWHHAGRKLAEIGVTSVSAGVYGEVLGGHYGRAMILGGTAKIGAVSSSMWAGRRYEGGRDASSLNQVLELLRVRPYNRPWFLHDDYWHTVPDPAASMNQDIERDVDRLRRRGVTTADQLVEAFISEHRGTQYINTQVRSCRANVDVSLPYIDRELLLLGSRIPLAAKIHNAVNRAMLKQFCPAMLDYPLAATLLPAKAPLILQELSRLGRKLREDGHWKMHFVTNGRLPPPRLAWVNLEFLRTTGHLMTIVRDLQCPIWDHHALQRRVDRLGSGEWRQPVHPLFDILLKIYTIDLMLR